MRGVLKTKFKGTTYKLEGNVFNINESANTCSMKLSDGSVEHNLPFNKVDLMGNSGRSALHGSRLNEGVWGAAARFLKVAFKKVGGYLLSFINGKVAPAISPIITALAFDKGELNSGIVVIPSESSRDFAAEQGINIVGGSADDIQENEDALANDVESINSFWNEVMAKEKSGEDLKESFNQVLFDRQERIYESKLGIAEKLGAAKYYQLFEKYSLEANEATNMPNRNYDQVKKMVMRAYYERITKGDDAKMRPIMIWGAPGIGKTSIIKDLIREMNETLNFRGAMIEIDATSINPDDFSLPAIDVDSNVARDIPKTWFPAYKVSQDKAENAKLDAIANGAIGEDDDRAAGGIIFIDEFSRIRKATMQVLMKLVDQRSINDLKLGSKWLIVCAGNREEDMGGDSINWQMAWGSRYINVNYVPDFEHWVEWAQEAGVEKDIIKFLKLNTGLWYDLQIRDEQTNFANPRTWKSLSDNIKAERDLNKAMGLRNVEPSDADKVALAADTVGNRASTVLQGYYKLQSKFSPEMARDVWTHGDEVDVTFKLDPPTVQGAFETILDNAPENITQDNIKKLYDFVDKVLVEANNDAMLKALTDMINRYIFDTYSGKTSVNDIEKWILAAHQRISARLKEQGKSARAQKL